MTRRSDEYDQMIAEALENDETRVTIEYEHYIYNEDHRLVPETRSREGRSKWFREFAERLRDMVPGPGDLEGLEGQSNSGDMEFIYQEYQWLTNCMRALGNKQVKETLAGDEKNRVSDIYGTEMNPNLEEVQALQRIWERWVRPYNEAVKAVEELRVANEQCCPECGSDLIESDGESEADGCAQDWAEWLHYWSWCSETECDWSKSGRKLLRSGGSF